MKAEQKLKKGASKSKYNLCPLGYPMDNAQFGFVKLSLQIVP